MRVAYLDAASGISGDLCLGALVAVGVPVEEIQDAVDLLGIDGLQIAAARTTRGGVAATKVDVTYPVQHEPRRLSRIVALIAESPLAESVKVKATAVFERLAVAEAAVHGVSVEEVHFHEVGAADALADIVGSVAGLGALGVDALLVGSINVGSGRVRCAHGLLPVPAPATRKLLRGWRCGVAGPSRELTTPTGAALVTTLAHQVDAPPAILVERSGCGAGGSDHDGWANVLRLVVGEAGAIGTEAPVGPRRAMERGRNLHAWRH